MKVLLVFLVLELTTVAVVDCMRCYNCTNCNDPFEESDTISKINCPSEQCYKYEEYIEDEYAVTRGCNLYKISNNCTVVVNVVIGNDTDEFVYSTCNKDLCNGSPTLGTSLKFLSLLAAVMFIAIPLRI